MEELSSKKRIRNDSDELGIHSPEVKRIREDLLVNLDDGEIYAASHELDLFMKSFAEEIAPVAERSESWTDLTSGRGHSLPELGFLLEASDDELGLPPSSEEKTEFGIVESDSSELSDGLWELDGDIPGFDPFVFGSVVEADNCFDSNEFVVLDGLFDYSDLGFGSSDFRWRPETLLAK